MLDRLFGRKKPRTPEEKAQRFWDWFTKHHQPYLFLREVSESELHRLLQTFTEKLHQYNPHVYFEIGGHPDDELVELVLTAAGISEHFPAVELLASQAPQVKGWEVVPFKQPHEGGFKTQYEGYEFDPESILFIGLPHESQPDAVGLRVFYPDYSEENRAVFYEGTYLMLDVILGEKSAALDIDYLDVQQTPEDIGQMDFGTLIDVRAFVNAIKERST